MFEGLVGEVVFDGDEGLEVEDGDFVYCVVG